MISTPILFDYGSSPYSQKVHLFCAAARVAINSCEQPPVLPRPTLESLGVTYRRIPILAIGKDVFADSSLIIEVLEQKFNSKLATSPADKAFEVFGTSLFQLALRIIPVETLDPAFVKDRETIFPEIIRPDHEKQRPSALAELRATLDIVERQFLGHRSSFISGEQISMSDVHVAWVVKWLLVGTFGMKKQPGFGKTDLPKIYAWLERLPSKEPEKLSDDEAVKCITSGSYFVMETPRVNSDPLDFLHGHAVSVENSDAVPGAHHQHGKLVGLTIDRATVQLDNELRVHFPRKGTIITEA